MQPATPPDIEAEIYFLTTEEGGRRSPCRSGYRPSHDFGAEGTLNAAAHVYVGVESVCPGDTVLTRLWLAQPDFHLGRLFEGFEFTVQEGPRVVGRGRITRVLNEALAVSGH